MAKGDDLDLNVASAVPGAKKGGSFKLIIFLALGLLVGAGVAAAVAFFLLGQERDPFAASDPSRIPLIYMPLSPAFIGNVEGGGRVRFFQVELVVAARDQRALDAVEQHMPVIRNNLLMLMSSQPLDRVMSHEGREAVRGEMLIVIQDVLRERIGRPGVDELYFTSFVFQ